MEIVYERPPLPYPTALRAWRQTRYAQNAA